MRLADLAPGWRTDFILHRFGAQVIERDDCLVVRTPTIPTFYWGNALLLPAVPGDGDLARWLALFDDEIGRLQPQSRHVAIGVPGATWPLRLPAWEAAGFELIPSHLLHATAADLRPPGRRPTGEVRLRTVDFTGEAHAAERDAVIEVECTDAGSFERAGHVRYLNQQWERYRDLHAAGLLEWFGLWCDGVLAATCGLIRDRAEPGATARFQRVVTHPASRRRGLCTDLVHRVSRLALDEWQAAEIFMVAHPDDVAIGIYRSLGYRTVDGSLSLQRKAPEDRPT
jgi:ribosomal protein S18 acetylase RimI-like enzyme